MCRLSIIQANRLALRCSLVALSLVLLPAALHAQAVSIASVTGRVVDEQGAVVSGAQIKMTGVDTGVAYSAVSNADGIYAFPSLPIARTGSSRQFPGFKPMRRTAFNCEATIRCRSTSA